ncbi:MAG TPA: hypothetical protein VNA04_16890 [Thermoanaerobaculia bacterium]|nr:hypothetical protein [Thermoanaerobaculia bacterium]
MRVARGRADARWLPSRHRFAASRLIAYLVFRSIGPKERPGIVLAVHRDQSALENHAVGAWLMGSLTCFSFGILERFMTWPAAAILSPFAALVFVQVFPVLPVVGPPRVRQRSNADLVSFLTMFATTMLAIYFAGTGGWVRYPAWVFLAVLGVNGAAWVVARLMRGRFEAAEREAGVA